jgi:putative transcriptional regulator
MVLLLYEVTSHRHARLKGLAEKLGMTVAGVSEYVKGMEADGLIRHVAGEYRATKKGVEFLQERFRALRTFVESSAREIAIIDQTIALAAESLDEGDRVGLFMEDGTLVARRKPSPSVGVAVAKATRGDPVWVRDLEGIVELRPGKVSIGRIIAKSNPEGVRRAIRRGKPNVLAILDVQAKSLAAKAAVKSMIEFAVVPATIEAAQRGLPVLLLCSEDRVAEVVAGIEAANARSEDKIPYETLTI